MTDKVISTIEAICKSPEMISGICQSGTEYFFEYSGFYFSILARTHEDEFGRYSFYVYPKYSGPTVELMKLSDEDWGESEKIPMVTYHSADFDNDGAFKRLYHIVGERYLGVDAIFENILRFSENQ